MKLIVMLWLSLASMVSMAAAKKSVLPLLPKFACGVLVADTKLSVFPGPESFEVELKDSDAWRFYNALDGIPTSEGSGNSKGNRRKTSDLIVFTRELDNSDPRRPGAQTHGLYCEYSIFEEAPQESYSLSVTAKLEGRRVKVGQREWVTGEISTDSEVSQRVFDHLENFPASTNGRSSVRATLSRP